MTQPISALDYLITLPRFTDQGAAAYKPGLERMHALLKAMGHPHRAFESVHIAGTNGKGSTASLVAAIATASGRRVGLHTSPHLFSLTERMRIDGVPASEAWLDRAVARYREVFERVGPSFFEATVALSFLYFAEEQVDLAVVEVGLGGRLDATNVIQPALTIITNIGLEHSDILGTTHRQIAREKAGIIKPGVPLLTAADHPDAIETIHAIAEAQNTPYHRVQDEAHITHLDASTRGITLDVQTPQAQYHSLQVGLPGPHQQWNAILALRTAELLFDEVRHDSGCIYRGLREVRQLSGLMGRFDVLQERPLIVADVAHNAEGLAVTLKALEPVLGTRGRRFVLFGAMRDKDVHRMADLLAGHNASVYCITVDSDRAYGSSELEAIFRARRVDTVGSGNLQDGWEKLLTLLAPEDVLLITGSHQVVSQVPLYEHPNSSVSKS